MNSFPPFAIFLFYLWVWLDLKTMNSICWRNRLETKATHIFLNIFKRRREIQILLCIEMEIKSVSGAEEITDLLLKQEDQTWRFILTLLNDEINSTSGR